MTRERRGGMKGDWRAAKAIVSTAVLVGIVGLAAAVPGPAHAGDPVAYDPSELLVNPKFTAQISKHDIPGWTFENWHKNKNSFAATDNGLTISRAAEGKPPTARQRVPIGAHRTLRLRGNFEMAGSGKLSADLVFTGKNGWLGQKSFVLAPKRQKRVEIRFSVPVEAKGQHVTHMSVGLVLNGGESSCHLSGLSLKSVDAPDTPAKGAEPGLYVEGAGTPIQFIDLSETPTWFETEAARILRAELTILTGVLPTVRKLAGPGRAVPGTILVGTAAVERGLFRRAEQARLTEGAYAIRVRNGTIGIVAGTGDGLVSGAYGLFKEAGVTYLTEKTAGGYPRRGDNLVRICSTGKRLGLRPGTKTAAPAFALRFDNRGHPAVGYTCRRHVLGNAGAWARARRRAVSGHTFPHLLPVREYYKEHPEYFALGKKGERVKSPPGHLCLSHPEVERIIARRVLEWIEAQPDCRYFYIGQGDGRAWCQCEKCRALDTVPGEVTTDRMLWFVNKIARAVRGKYPDKYMVFLAYTDATGPAPKRTKPEPNVLIMYCMYPYQWLCDSHAFCEENRIGVQEVEDWLKLCGPQQVYIEPHPRGYRRALEIFPAFYAEVERIRHYHKLGVNRITFCGLPQSYGSLFDHVIGKLLWDPSIGVEKAIDEFMPLYYGKAGPYMRAHFDQIERHIRQRNIHQKCEGANPGLVNADFAKEAYRLFAKAEQAAGGDVDALWRIGNEKIKVLYCDLEVRNKVSGTAGDPDAYAGRLAEFMRLARDRRLRDVGRKHHRSLSRWFWHTARLRFEKEPWYRDPEVDAFLKDPLAVLGREVCVQEKVEGGWRIPATGFSGGEEPEEPRNGREILVLRRGALPASRTCAYVELEQASVGKYELEIEGIDGQRTGATQIDILVNGRSVFRGANEFTDYRFSRRSFPVPRGLLRTGKNRIELRNLTPEKRAETGKRRIDFVAGRRVSRHWGWFILSEAVVREAR